MNIKQVKERYTLQDILASLGFTPDKQKSRGADLWYASPFRPDEKIPSFHIHTAHDIWKDFGGGEPSGGDLIAFMQRCLKEQGRSNGISDVLQWFRSYSPRQHRQAVSDQAQQAPLGKAAGFRLLSDKPIFSQPLWDYLETRGVSSNVARQHLRQIYFEHAVSGKKIYGLGMQNESGGFEVRNPLGFKCVVGKKDISLWKAKASTSKIIEIFEGMFDKLTLLSIAKEYQDRSDSHDSMVLHSTALIERAVQRIRAGGYERVIAWLDNDVAGNAAHAFLEKELKTKGIALVNMQHLYSSYKDLNDWHVAEDRVFKPDSIVSLELVP